MRIVFLSPSAERGGAEAVLLEMVKVLRRMRPDWSLHIIAGENGPLVEKITDLGATAEVLPLGDGLRELGEQSMSVRGGMEGIIRLLKAAGATNSYRRALHRRLRTLRPDIVHSNGMKMHFLSALALTRNVPARLIWHMHDYLSGRKLMRKLLRLVVGRCDLVIAISESVANDTRTVLGSTRVETIYNAVDTTVFSPEGDRLDLDRLAASSPPAQPVIRVGLVATYARWKGHDIFLQAIARLRESRQTEGLIFYLIGGPVYSTAGSQYSRAELEEMVERLGLGELVRFTGFVDDVAGALRSLDIVIHASTEPEPFGLVIAQAMACGRAAISTATGGASELVSSEESALAIVPGLPNELASAIARLAKDAELRTNLGRAGRKHVLDHFSPTQMGQHLTSIYDQLKAA